MTEAASVHTVTSFHASSLEPEQLRAVMADYLALERARVYRRLSLVRFAALGVAVGVAGPGFHWIPTFASWLGAVVCMATPASAWIAEVWQEWRLARRLSQLPEGSIRPMAPPSAPLDG